MRKSTVIWALIALNVVLLTSFVWRLVPDNSAIAQQAAVRRPGDYLLVPIHVNGSSSGILVALDQTNGLLTALSYGDSTGKMEFMPKIDLKRIFQGAPRGGAR